MEYVPGRTYTGGVPRSDVLGGSRDTRLIDTRVDGGYGAVRALDPKTGEVKWEFKMGDVTDAGILTTASDLLFTGNRDQYFYALDARSGKQLWKRYLGGLVAASPITYLVDGKQYVSIAAGHSLFTFGL